MRFDYGIIGGGLSGCLLAYYLIMQGRRVLLVERNTIGSGASGTPLAMINPATGRFAKKGFKSLESIAQIDALQQINPFTKAQDFIQNRGIIRPCFDPEIAQKTQQNYLADQWGKGVAEWVTPDEVAERFPLINPSFGALVVHNGYVVNPKMYLHNLINWLKDQPNLTLLEEYKGFTSQSVGTSHTNQLADPLSWVFTGKEDEMQANVLIHCTGAEEIINAMIPGVIVKGQTLQFQLVDSTYEAISPTHVVKKQDNQTNNWSSFLKEYAISAQGYLCSLDGSNLVMGSTYEHRFPGPLPDSKGNLYLKNKLDRIHERLSSRIVQESMWAGFRFSTPDRMPIIDELPTYKGHYVFRGLGSKGLLYSHYYAQLFAASLSFNHPLPPEVTLDRFKEFRNN
jgi:glycine oxidase